MDERGVPPAHVGKDGQSTLSKRVTTSPARMDGVLLLIDFETDAAGDLAGQAQNSGIVRAPLSALTARLLSETLPNSVVVPLIGRDSDAVSVIAHLAGLGYRGRILVLAPRLPDRTMVEQELRAEAKGLTVDLIEES